MVLLHDSLALLFFDPESVIHVKLECGEDDVAAVPCPED